VLCTHQIELQQQRPGTMTHSSHAKRLRDRAEQCREPAETMKTAESRNEYLALARAYESLAETRTLFAKLRQRAVTLDRELDA
jgi:hypothetical protein